MDDELRSLQNSEPNRWQSWRQRSNKWVRRLRPFAIIILSAFVGVILFDIFFPPLPPMSQDNVDESIAVAMASATPPQPYSSFVYQTILPSLVFIQTEREGEGDEDGVSIGSGVVVNENGEILTALHVVADGQAIEVVFADGTHTTAVLAAAEPENDIAILQPTQLPELLVPATLGNPGRMRIGDEAFAVGNPLGLVGSMSAGVISGFDRSIPIGEEAQRLEGLIQFDTAVNPGSSGGPLLNRQGQVVGIVTALANPAEQNFFVGIGFAVPIGTAIAAGGGAPGY